jgi:hypothetical protein
MCKVHDKVSGQGSVELYAEARILNNTCTARMNYLRAQAVSFHTWLETQNWCEDATKFCQNIVSHTEKALDPDSDKWCEYLFSDKEINHGNILADEFDSYAKELEAIANKGMSKAFSDEQKIKDLEARLEKNKEELKLHNQISDFIDTLPQYTKEGQYKAVFKRLDARKNEGKLSYSGWVTFSNVLMVMMGKQEYKPKYEIKCVADEINKIEGQIADLNKKIMEKPDFFRDVHPEADEFIKING